MNQQVSIQTEQFEEKLRNASKDYSALTYMDDKIYFADGRFEDLNKSNELVNVAALKAAMDKPAGEVDPTSIYTNKYLTQYKDYEKIFSRVQNTGITPRQAAGKVTGAAGPESLTHYENIKKTSELIGNVIGQKRILEELNAVNIAEKVSTTSLKAEYVRKTSSLLAVEQEIGDRQIPSPLRQAFAIGKKEIFADATSWATELRDKDSKVDLMAEFQAELPGMFLKSKHDKVITLVNALSGNNQGNWTATTGNFYDVDAAADVQTAEDAIKNFSGEKICLLNSDTYRAYLNNIGSAFDGKAGNKSLSEVSEKSGTLAKNPGVKYYVTDDITSASYVMAKKGSYMKWLQGMVINTFFEDVRMPGAPKQKFWFDFNGFDESEVLASYRATTVTS